MTEETKRYLKIHPIQLTSIEVLELFIRKNVSFDKDINMNKQDVIISHGQSEYDEENNTVHVGIKLEYGMEEEPETPFSMRVELVGNFQVDEKRFKKHHVADWAKRNAHVILYPFLREHAFGLTLRCDLPPVILPLVVVPTFTVEKPEGPKESEE